MIALSTLANTNAGDWPQWMGPSRDGTYTEEGIIDAIPEGGLKVLWRQEVSLGYSGPAVVGDRVFVTDYVRETGDVLNNPGGRASLTGEERILCLDASSGKVIWSKGHPRPYNISYPSGPRATPTVDGDHVYALGAEGDLVCLKIADGEIVWHRQLQEEYKTQSPIWGYAAHPLVAGDTIYTLAGGEGSAVVALDKHTGTEKWRALSTKDIGYCPPRIYEIGGQQQLIVWHSDSINGLNPESGQVLWTYPLQPRYGMSIAAPQIQNGKMFACGIGETSAMFTFGEDGKPKDTLWKGKPKIGVYSGNATSLFTKDAIFGADCGSGQFIAVNPDTGERFWETFKLTTSGTRRASHGTAFVVKNGDKYLIFAETGDLILAKLSKDKFEELGRMKVLEPTGECFGRSVVWSHPAFANKCMYARNDKEIVCVSLAK